MDKTPVSCWTGDLTGATQVVATGWITLELRRQNAKLKIKK
jgi:hypothetical protein